MVRGLHSYGSLGNCCRNLALRGLAVEMMSCCVCETVLYLLMVPALWHLSQLLFRRRFRVKGKNVLVTGAGAGIGRLMALNFAKEGANVILWDIQSKLLEKVEKEIKKLGVDVYSQVVDVSNREGVLKAAKEAKEKMGHVSVVVNNAGVVKGRAVLDSTESDIRRTMEVNTLAHFWAAQAFLQDMLDKDDGKIVTIASTMALSGAPKTADYCASKAAVKSFTECLRMEIKSTGKKNVSTLLVCPFAINTGMFNGLKIRFEYITPVLEETYVADQVVAGVKSGKELLIIPWLFTWLPMAMELILPTTINDFIIDFMGGAAAMDSFKGRGEGWAK